jgi:hypothetical protein
VHGISVHDIDAAPVINQDPTEFDIDVGPDECRIKYQSITPGFGMTLGWSFMLQLISCSDQYMNLGTVGMTAFTSIARRRWLCLSVDSVTKTT